MIEKIVAGIQVWVGLAFFIALLSFIPGIAVAGSYLLGIYSFAGKIPFYGLIVSVMGTVLFINGIIKLIHH